MMRRSLQVAVIALLCSSCGYLNSLYNARKQFADAERAASRGDRTTAQNHYTGAIEKAAKSYRKYPRGRWSDDALYLIARSRFELGEFPAARAAAAELLSVTSDATLRADAHAIAGAAAVQMQEPAAAVVHLDSAMEKVSDVWRGRALLWRARAYRELGDAPRAWQDLDAIDSNDPAYASVQLDRIAFGIEQQDSARTASAFSALLGHRNARGNLDTIADLALLAVGRFGADATRHMLNASLPEWLAGARDSIALVRADLAMRAGDTTAATTELTQLAGRSSATVANAARLKLARARLKNTATLEDLRAVRTLLLPAIADISVPAILRNVRIVEALVEKAQTAGQPVALFAAAEIARDELGAPMLARRLFITFVDMAAQTPWSPKALLAAIALDPDAGDAAALRARLAGYTTSPYLQATDAGADAEALDMVETRLQRSLLSLKEEGAILADQQDVAVGRVVATLDSMRAVARTDSTRIACGLMIDTLALAGTRADSVRTACMRADTIKVAEYLVADTMALRGEQPRDSVTARRRTPARGNTTRDTIIR